VAYLLTGDESTARAKAEDILIEQTVEFPVELVPPGDIRDHIFGRIEEFCPFGDDRYEVTISYANETAGSDLVQFLNVVYGNISLKPGIRLVRFELSESKLAEFRGPRFGRQGLRDIVGAHDRALMCSALKPMGLSNRELARMAYEFALGGLDLIKDDHGLADQSFTPFKERVELCAEAVARANAETGLNCLYFASVTTRVDRVQEYAHFAKDAGAGGLLICPGLTGFDLMRVLADDDDLALPIMSHPSFYGSYVGSPDSGIAHGTLYGQLQRLAGADLSVYPNFGGRFSFSIEECREIVSATEVPMRHLKPIFPAPGGGLTMEAMPRSQAVYGTDVVYLVGGGLHRHSKDLTQNVRYFLDLIR
jgi:ribulose-bisphosphate carboxylase large chain